MKASPGAIAPVRRSPAPPQRAGIQSLEVGFALLEVLSSSPGPLMLRDLAAKAGMSAAKAHRYLVSFQRLEPVVQDPATALYDLGPAALKLGLASLSRLDSVKLARQRLQPLMAETGQTLPLGTVVLGSPATFDTAWDCAVARPVATAARQLSRELGFEAA